LLIRLRILGDSWLPFATWRNVVVGFKKLHRADCAAELFAQQIEAHSTLHVERRVNLAAHCCVIKRFLRENRSYPEYTGTALTAVLHEPPQNDSVAVFHRVQDNIAHDTAWK